MLSKEGLGLQKEALAKRSATILFVVAVVAVVTHYHGEA